jgi:hypothetical protein
MAFALPFALILAAVGQDEPTGGTHDTPAARLEFMKTSLKRHAVHSDGDPKTELKLYREAWRDSRARHYVWGFSAEP